MFKTLSLGDLVAQNMSQIVKSDEHKSLFKKAEIVSNNNNHSESLKSESKDNLSHLIDSVAELGDYLDDAGLEKSASAALFTLETLISEAKKKQEKGKLPEFLKKKMKKNKKDNEDDEEDEDEKKGKKGKMPSFLKNKLDKKAQMQTPQMQMQMPQMQMPQMQMPQMQMPQMMIMPQMYAQPAQQKGKKQKLMSEERIEEVKRALGGDVTYARLLAHIQDPPGLGAGAEAKYLADFADKFKPGLGSKYFTGMQPGFLKTMRLDMTLPDILVYENPTSIWKFGWTTIGWVTQDAERVGQVAQELYKVYTDSVQALEQEQEQ